MAKYYHYSVGLTFLCHRNLHNMPMSSSGLMNFSIWVGTCMTQFLDHYEVDCEFKKNHQKVNWCHNLHRFFSSLSLLKKTTSSYIEKNPVYVLYFGDKNSIKIKASYTSTE